MVLSLTRRCTDPVAFKPVYRSCHFVDRVDAPVTFMMVVVLLFLSYTRRSTTCAPRFRRDPPRYTSYTLQYTAVREQDPGYTPPDTSRTPLGSSSFPATQAVL